MSVAENPHRFKDPRAQEISNIWFLLREKATNDQKDKVSIIYISTLLGLGDEVAQKFVNGDSEAWHKVGMKQAGIPLDTDVSSFWQEVQQIFPDLHTQEDIDYLIREGGLSGTHQFRFHLDDLYCEESPVLFRLTMNAEKYK